MRQSSKKLGFSDITCPNWLQLRMKEPLPFTLYFADFEKRAILLQHGVAWEVTIIVCKKLNVVLTCNIKIYILITECVVFPCITVPLEKNG